MLSISFLSSTRALVLACLIVFLLVPIAKIPLTRFLSSIKSYALIGFPVLLGITVAEHGQIVMSLELATVAYLRFLNLFSVAAMFTLTTSSFDAILLALKYKRTRGLGVSLSAALSTFMAFGKNVQDVIVFQRLRGLLSIPRNLGELSEYFQAIMIPVVMKAVSFSEEFHIAMVCRGYGSERVTLPPTTKMRITDVLAVVVSTSLLAVSFCL